MFCEAARERRADPDDRLPALVANPVQLAALPETLTLLRRYPRRRQLLEPHRDRLRVDDRDLASFIVVQTTEGIGFNATNVMFNERLVDEVGDLLLRYLVDNPA